MLAIAVIGGVLLILLGNDLFSTDASVKSKIKVANSEVQLTSSTENTSSINSDGNIDTNRMSSVLETIEGVGKVNVLVTYNSGYEKILAYDIKDNNNKTTEKDKDGGIKETQEKAMDNKVVFEEPDNSMKKPLVVKEKMPEIKGVLIVAQGAENNDTREKLINCAVVLFNLPSHKIIVMNGK